MALTAIIYNRVMWGEELDDSSGTLVFGKFVWGKQCRVYHPPVITIFMGECNATRSPKIRGFERFLLIFYVFSSLNI
jgi:hypothetical protein